MASVTRAASRRMAESAPLQEADAEWTVRDAGQHTGQRLGYPELFIDHAGGGAEDHQQAENAQQHEPVIERVHLLVPPECRVLIPSGRMML